MSESLLLLESCDAKSLEMIQNQKWKIFTYEDEIIDFDHVNHIFTKLNFRLDQFFLSKYPNLRTIITPTTSVDHIDTNFCKNNGITIISLRDTKGILETFSSTSEIAAWLMLSLSRNAVPAATDVKSGNWRRNDFIGNTLRGKRVGIVGFGRLGKQFSRVCAAFGMTILAYDLREESDNNVIFTSSLEQLVEQSDFVSLHIDDREENRGLINAQLLKHFLPHAILVNTSRGFIVNENDLVDAIMTNKIAGYGTDVLDGERGDDSRWLSSSLIWREYEQGNPRLLVLPHIGGAVHENIPTAEMAVFEILLGRRG